MINYLSKMAFAFLLLFVVAIFGAALLGLLTAIFFQSFKTTLLWIL